MRAIFSRSTVGSSFTSPRHLSALCQGEVSTEKVPDILGKLRNQYGRKGYALAEVQTDGKTVYAVLTKGNYRMPVVENI